MLLPSDPPKLEVHIHGVVIPSWLAVCLLLVGILAAISLLLGWRQQVILERELRVLQLHAADIENVLIRQNVAKRDDFAMWRATPIIKPVPVPLADKDNKDKE